ncbi:MAG: hypothetical protein HQ522_15625 [Bacteroidetes bacterium]|nr:hypothetical protein [Bacteroidota bacterium]
MEELSIVNSLLKNLDQKRKSPILGTIILVWCAHHWELLFGLVFFNYDSTLGITNRIEWINYYFKDIKPFWNLVGMACIALGVLILTYTLISISKAITSFFMEIVNPWIYSLFNSTKFMLRETHNELLEEYDKLAAKLNEEQKKRLGSESNLERTESLLKEEKIVSTDLQKKLDELDNAIDDALKKKEKEEVEDETDEELAQDILNKDIQNTKTTISQKIYIRLRMENKLEKFRKYLGKILNNDLFSDDDDFIKDLLIGGLVIIRETGMSGGAYYKLTKLGEEVHSYAIDYNFE